MKNVLFTLVLVFIFNISNANKNKITAEIVFENNTDKECKAGVLYIKETQESIVVNSLENFNITLPKKGNYHFKFISEEFSAKVEYLSKLNSKNNIITIKLFEKRTSGFLSTELEGNLTDEQFEERITSGNVNFISFGLVSLIPEEFVAFKEKYGIGLIVEGCVVDLISTKKTSRSNQVIANYLSRKYGEDWKSELPFLPIGIK